MGDPYERLTGIEPAMTTWKDVVLPLHHSRVMPQPEAGEEQVVLAEAEGFEPSRRLKTPWRFSKPLH